MPVPNPATQAVELRADLYVHGDDEALAPRIGHERRAGAEAVDHGPGQAVLALERDFFQRAVEHAEHLLGVGVDVKFGIFVRAFARFALQRDHLLHLVHTVVAQVAFGVGDEIVVAIFPTRAPRG